jgi:hypothetical protein
MEERNNKTQYETRTIAIPPRDWERIQRMAKIQDRSASSLIRTIVMPFVEEFEQVNGLPTVDFSR